VEIRKKIKIHSSEAKWILEKKLSNDALAIQISMVKLSRIYRIAYKNQAAYAYITLSHILERIYKTKQSLQKLADQLDQVLLDKKIDFSNIEILDSKIYDMRIGVSLSGELIALIELYDRVNCLIKIADKVNLFKNRYTFLKSLSRCHRYIMRVISDILSVDESKIDKISISQYLNNTTEYLEVSKAMGEITPEALYAALNIDMFPRLPPVTRNKIIHQLKHME